MYLGSHSSSRKLPGCAGTVDEDSLAQQDERLVERVLAFPLGAEAPLLAWRRLPVAGSGRCAQVSRPGGPALADAPAHQGRSPMRTDIGPSRNPRIAPIQAR